MKLKRKSIILVSLTIALLCAAFGIQPIKGYANATRTVGVQVGYWAEYNVLADGNMTTFVNKTNTPTYEKVTVAEISGTNVTCQDFMRFMNMTEKTETGIIDVESGSGNLTLFLIAADLNAGDLVYTGSWGFTGAIINETTTRNYLGSDVTVNHMNLTQQSSVPGYSGFASFNCFWFRDTGMLAEAIMNVTLIQSGVKTWGYLQMTITGKYVPEFPAILVLPLFAVLSTVAVASAKKRLIKKPSS